MAHFFIQLTMLFSAMVLADSTPIDHENGCPATRDAWVRTYDLAMSYTMGKGKDDAMMLGRALQPVIKCKSQVKEEDKQFVENCFKNLLQKIPNSNFILDHSKSPQKTQIPEDFQTPEFLELIKSRNNKDKLIAYVEKLNRSQHRTGKNLMVPVFYNSMSVNALESEGDKIDQGAKGRFIIYVPGSPEKWVQFGLHSNLENEATLPMVTSAGVVAVETSNGKSVTYMDDYTRKKDGLFEVYKNPFAKNCVLCHSGFGPVPIHFPNMKTDPQWEKVQKVNAAMPKQAYYAVEGEEPITFTKIPGMGTPGKRGKDFLMDCIGQTQEGAGLIRNYRSNSLSEQDHQRLNHLAQAIPAAMDCVSCHNSEKESKAPPLSWPFGCTSPFIDHLKTLNMPRNPKFPLTEQDIPILQSCLLMEYAGAIGPCEDKDQQNALPLSDQRKQELLEQSVLQKSLASPTCKSRSLSQDLAPSVNAKKPEAATP